MPHQYSRHGAILGFCEHTIEGSNVKVWTLFLTTITVCTPKPFPLTPRSQSVRTDTRYSLFIEHISNSAWAIFIVWIFISNLVLVSTDDGNEVQLSRVRDRTPGDSSPRTRRKAFRKKRKLGGDGIPISRPPGYYMSSCVPYFPTDPHILSTRAGPPSTSTMRNTGPVVKRIYKFRRWT